jgi:hypothetical protein
LSFRCPTARSTSRSLTSANRCAHRVSAMANIRLEGQNKLLVKRPSRQ